MSTCRCVLYARVSTDKQAEHGHSLAAQRTRLTDFAAGRRMEVVATVADEGQSGTTMQRAGMQQVLDLVDAGQVDAVVVTKADRVSRNVRDLLNLSAMLEQRGVALVTADEQFDTTTHPSPHHDLCVATTPGKFPVPRKRGGTSTETVTGSSVNGNQRRWST